MLRQIRGGKVKAIQHLEQLETLVKGRPRKTLSVAMGQDPHTIGATCKALNNGFIDVIVTGFPEKIKAVAKEQGVDISLLQIIEAKCEKEGIEKAIQLIHDGKADFLMKGLCSTPNYMRGILNKEKGLLPAGEVLSHVTVVEVPRYHKLMILSDVAVIPYPDLGQKIKMVQYCQKVANSLGIETPKAAIIAPTEEVNPKMPCTIDAAILSKMQDRKQFKNILIDGPLAMDLAISKESVKIKGVQSEVAGDTDIFIFPNIESANAIYKTLTYLAGGELAAIVAGASVPCVLTSRADSDKSKYYSILLGALNA